MIDPTDMDEVAVFRERFAARLRTLRHELGLTTAEVAARVGCTIRNYNKLERRAIVPTDQMLVRFRKAFRLDEVYFLVFPDANPLRHGLYELLRQAPEEVLLKTKAFVLEELRRYPAQSISSASGTAEPSSPPRTAASRSKP